MAIDPSSRRNFDPEVFNESNMRKTDGKYSATDYQATLELRKFIKDNSSDGFVSKEHIEQGVEKGVVNIGGKDVSLNEKQKAAFAKLAADDYSLYNRLDAGTKGVKFYDGKVGVLDAHGAIEDPAKLHGTDKSKKGYWTDASETMSKSKSKETLLDLFGDQKSDDSQVSLEWLRGWANNPAAHTNINPDHAHAAIVLLAHLDEVNQKGGDPNMITKGEIRNWKID